MPQTLADFRLVRKRRAANVGRWQAMLMPKASKLRRRKPPKSGLQTLLIARVTEEMEARGLNPNALSRRPGAPKQRTLDDVIYGGADPRLSTVQQIADGLGVHPLELLSQASGAKRDKVFHFPQYPQIKTGKKDKKASQK